MILKEEARLHEKVVQQIALDSLPREQPHHTTRRSNRVAQKVLVQLVDDLDGTDADETVSFGLDGVAYEIDLSKDNAKELRYRLEDFVAHARRVGKKAKKAAPKGTAHIREWARAAGYTVSNRGVVPAEIMQAYEAAH